MTNHIHHYDWIVSWDFNSDGNLIFTIGKSNAIECFSHYFYDVPDVKTGIEECQRTIDRIRQDSWHIVQLPAMDAMQAAFRVLKYPPPLPDFDREDSDKIPF